MHLGQTDLPVSAARALLGEDAVLGLSTHSRAQFERALKEDVDYLALGPIFTTTSKDSPYPALGTDLSASARHDQPGAGGSDRRNNA